MKRILVIEDEDIDYEKIKDFLTSKFEFINVELVSGAILDKIKKKESIIEYLKSNSFDLIILDLGLNGIGGIESDDTGNDIYDSLPQELKNITCFVSQTAAENLSKEKSKKFFIKTKLDHKFTKTISRMLGMHLSKKEDEQEELPEVSITETISPIMSIMALLLMFLVFTYAFVFLFFSIKHLFEPGHVKTQDIVHFVESFFLIALPIFMSFAIFIFMKKIVIALAKNRKPTTGTIDDSVKIINTVKNLFIGSIISYISLTLVSYVVETKAEDLNTIGVFAVVTVIVVLVWFWKILSKH